MKGNHRELRTEKTIFSFWSVVKPKMEISGTAHFLLGEVLSSLQVMGGIAVILAVIVLQMAGDKTASASLLEIRQQDK